MTESCGLCRLPNITLPTWTLCGHCFCDACIRRHVARVPKCPVCDEVVLMADLATAPNAAHFGSAPDPADPVPAPPDISSSSTAHAPEVAPFGLPPDGPPPYSSTPQGNRDFVSATDLGIDTRARAQPNVEYSTLLRNNGQYGMMTTQCDPEMRKRYKSLKKSVTLFSFIAVILFMIILCLLVMILAMKQNPVCDLSTPHSEALTVNIMGEIRYAREQAQANHRELQRQLSSIFSHHSNLITGDLSKQIVDAKENITTDFLKLEKKFNEIYRKVVLVQSQTAALKNISPRWNRANLLPFCLVATVISIYWHEFQNFYRV